MEMLLLTAIVLVGLFTLGFLLAWRIHNWSWVDVLWTSSFPILCASFFLNDSTLLDSLPMKVLSVMYLLWALRLGIHLARRILAIHPQMEGRYLKLQKQWQHREAFSFFVFFMFQAALVAMLSLPIFLVSSAREPFSNLWFVGVFVWVVSFGGEILADSQLEAFKSDPANKGKVCEAGLWAYSRHPNYFFECLMWLAYAILASFVHPWGWLAGISALLMLFLITKVTGIPPTEAQSLRSRGEAFRDYQRRVSAFVPWKPKLLKTISGKSTSKT